MKRRLSFLISFGRLTVRLLRLATIRVLEHREPLGRWRQIILNVDRVDLFRPQKAFGVLLVNPGA